MLLIEHEYSEMGLRDPVKYVGNCNPIRPAAFRKNVKASIDNHTTHC